jgi:hypothetical protein
LVTVLRALGKRAVVGDAEEPCSERPRAPVLEAWQRVERSDECVRDDVLGVRSRSQASRDVSVNAREVRVVQLRKGRTITSGALDRGSYGVGFDRRPLAL